MDHDYLKETLRIFGIDLDALYPTTEPPIAPVIGSLDNVQKLIYDVLSLDREASPNINRRVNTASAERRRTITIKAFKDIETVLVSFLTLRRIKIDPERTYDGGHRYHQNVVGAFANPDNKLARSIVRSPLSRLIDCKSTVLGCPPAWVTIDGLRKLRNQLTSDEGDDSEPYYSGPFKVDCSPFCWCMRILGSLLAALIVSTSKQDSILDASRLTDVRMGSIIRICTGHLLSDRVCKEHATKVCPRLMKKESADAKFLSRVRASGSGITALTEEGPTSTGQVAQESISANRDQMSSAAYISNVPAPLEPSPSVAQAEAPSLTQLMGTSEVQDLQDQLVAMKLRNSSLEMENRLLTARAEDTAAALEEAKARNDRASWEKLVEENTTLRDNLDAVKLENIDLQKTVREQSTANVELQQELMERALQVDRLITLDHYDQPDRSERLLRSLRDEIDTLKRTISRQGKEAEEGVWRSVQQGLSGVNLAEYLKTLHQAKEMPSYLGPARVRDRTTTELMGEARLSADDRIEGGVKLPALSQQKVEEDILFGGRLSRSMSERLATLERKG
ncbi:MAG: hypothetical protein Q9208_000019 [Pyrenodesmia sp. 3 TL-2023]